MLISLQVAAALLQHCNTERQPSAEVHFYDACHFALETYPQEIATAIQDFLGRQMARQASAKDYAECTRSGRGFRAG
jgi:hypothetical protein